MRDSRYIVWRPDSIMNPSQSWLRNRFNSLPAHAIIYLQHANEHVLVFKGAVHKVRQNSFRYFLTPPPSCQHYFYTYPSSLFSQFLAPPPQKGADVLYGWPQTLKGWWGGRAAAAAWCCEIYMEFALVCARYVCTAVYIIRIQKFIGFYEDETFIHNFLKRFFCVFFYIW